MSKLWIAVLLMLCPLTAYMQVNDNAVEQMISKRVLTAEDARFNIATIVPVLYEQDKLDTINALIGYYKKNFSSTAIITYYELLLSIRNRTFREELANDYKINEQLQIRLTPAEFYEHNILPYLHSYREGCNIRYSNANIQQPVREAYANYYDFLRGMAADELSITGLSPVEKWLLVYFATPDDTLYTALSRPIYDGSVLQKAWYRHNYRRTSITGSHLSLLAGVFIPSGNLSRIGSHPYMGFTLGGRKNKVMVDADLSFRFINAPQAYTTVASDNTLHTTQYYFGGYIGLDGGYELWRKNKHEADVLGGIAWDGFDALPSVGNTNNRHGNNNPNNNQPTRTINSLNLNIGLGYKFFLRQHFRAKDISRPYIAVQARYNLLNYQNTGGTSLSGNAFTFGLIYGAYHRKPTRDGIIIAKPKR